MKTEYLDVREALQRGRALPFSFVRSASQVFLGLTPAEIPDGILEARFFDSTEEIRIFPGEYGLQAVRLAGNDPGGVCLEETRKLMNPCFGEELSLRHEVTFDEDGQAHISTTCLSGWKGGGD